MNNSLNVDPSEIAKFEALAKRWWDRNSEFKPLHEINPLRLNYIDQRATLAGKKVVDTLPIIKVINTDLDHKASTGFLNDIFRKHDPSLVPVPRNKRRPNFLYIVQSSTRPVEFKFFVSNPKDVLTAHIRFIENLLRKNLPLKGIPIKIRLRTSRTEKRFGRKK